MKKLVCAAALATFASSAANAQGMGLGGPEQLSLLTAGGGALVFILILAGEEGTSTTTTSP